MKTVFDYTDYRVFLQDTIQEKRRKNPAYSLETLSRQTGALSKSSLSLILNGKRDISAKKIHSLGQALRLTARALIYFENLILFNQSKDSRTKEEYFQRLARSRPKRLQTNLEIHQAEILENWHAMILREMVTHPDFSEEPTEISKRLKGRISAREARTALERLLRTRLLKRDETGRLQKTDEILKSSDEIRSLALQRYHKSCLELGKRIITEDEIQDREFCSVSISLTPEQFQEIKNRIKEFRDEIAQMETEEKKENKVCQINIQFFQMG